MSKRAREYARTFPDRSIYVGAFLGDTMIGFIKLVTDETRTHACMVHILSMIRHRDKAPTNALLAQAVKTCAERGISYLVYENFSYGKKQGDSLSHFKEVNGFQRMDLPSYYVPLTPLGRVALSPRPAPPLKDHLPESLAAKLRELTNCWYDRKFQLKSRIALRRSLPGIIGLITKSSREASRGDLRDNGAVALP